LGCGYLALDYPLTAYNVLVQMGIGSGIRTALSFLKSRILLRSRQSTGEQDETVEDWAINSFGEHLYRTFFKPYHRTVLESFLFPVVVALNSHAHADEFS